MTTALVEGPVHRNGHAGFGRAARGNDLGAIPGTAPRVDPDTFRYAGRQDRDRMAKDLRPVYTAPTAAAAEARFAEFADTWGARYPAVVRLWRNAWTEFVPFVDYDVEIRKVICTTNAIESLNARYRRAIRARGHFPTEQAALKCLYLATRALDPTGRGRARWVIRWKPALNAFAITFEGRLHPTTTN